MELTFNSLVQKKLDLKLDRLIASGHFGPVLRQLASLGPILNRFNKNDEGGVKKVGSLRESVCEMSVLRQNVVQAALLFLVSITI